MKWVWKILFAVICLLMPLTVCAEENNDLMKEFEFSELNDIMDEIFPREKMSFSELLEDLISGKKEWSLETIRKWFFEQLTYEWENSRTSVIYLLVLIIVAAIFANFSSVFKSTQVSEISFSMLYMFVITICLNNFRILAETASANIATLIEFMEVLGPVYFLAVAMATGSSTSVTFYHLLLLFVFLAELVVLHFLVPLTQLYLMMKLLGEFSTEIHLSKFADFLETLISWTLKTMMAGVIGINLIQGMLNPAIDSVKRSILTRGGESIPIIGNLVGGTAEVILGTAVLIKNGIGVAGMIVCIAVCARPVIQIAMTALLYQFIAALAQPISDKRMVNCIGSMADGSKLLLRIVSATGIIFLLTIAVVATISGGT